MSNQPLYTLYKLKDLKDMTAYPEEIIKSMLYKGLITTLWGPPDSGKSHIAADLACSISQYLPVTYVSAEAHYEIVARSRAWLKYYNIDDNENLSICKDPLLLMHRSHVDAFIAVNAATSKPALVVIDPLAQCLYGGDENQTKDMATATYHMNLICKTLNCSILVVAHTGVNRSRERGSTVLRGACRASFSVDKTIDNKITMRSEKLNAGKPMKDMHFEILQSGDNEMDTILVPISSKSEETTSQATRQLQVLQAMDMEIFSNGVTKQELKLYLEESVGMPKSTVYTTINQVMKKDYVEKKSQSLIVITDYGRTQVSKSKTLLDSASSSLSPKTQNWSLTPSYPSQLSITEQKSLTSSLIESNENSIGPVQKSNAHNTLKECGETGLDSGLDCTEDENSKDKKKVVN